MTQRFADDWRKLVFESRLIPIALFILALGFRLYDFNATSITYDELAAKDSGPWWQLVKSGDFTSEGWGYQKPRVAIMRWIYGVIPQALCGDDPGSSLDMAGSRAIAAVLGSILVVGVYLMGRQMAGAVTGILAAVIFSLLPTVLGHDRYACHDLPARVATVFSLWFMIRHFQTQSRRDWLASAILAGVSFAAYFRVGAQTIFVLQLALCWRWIVGRRWVGAKVADVAQLVSFSAISGVLGVLLFILSWPYMWPHPIATFIEMFAQPVSMVQGGASLEWFFGESRLVPFYYYLLIDAVMMPVGVLLVYLAGLCVTAKQACRGRDRLLLWLFVFVPMAAGTYTFRSALNHYLMICYPATAVLGALGILAVARWLSRWRFSIDGWRWGLGTVIVASEILIAVRIHPYHLEYFNGLVGGTRSVAENRTFLVGWYGEGIRPLFEYVNQNAPTNALVTCRLGPWPGLGELRRYLRPDLDLQGYSPAANPLGADYVLRVGLETGSEFYRWVPDPEFYEKAMDVTAMGGSIGDVWKRRPNGVGTNHWIYTDDFSSPLVTRYAAGGRNLDLNPFSDGKLFPVKPGEAAGILLKIPSAMLGKATMVQIRSRVQIQGGSARIQCGSSSSNLVTVATCEAFRGVLESPPVKRPGKGDLWIALEMGTRKTWNGHPRTFWDYDWFDSVDMRAWP